MPGESRATRLFISYSRADLAFADKLDGALKTFGFETLIDRRDIQKFEDWWARIQSLIVQSDTVIFVLTPDSLKNTSVCQQEITFAQSLNKRLAPIIFHDIDDAAVPPALRRLNWIDFRDQSQFDARVRDLVDALETDIEWIRRHTGFGEFARRWDAAGRPGPGGLMLRPPLLTEAEAWLQLRPCGAPEPTELLKEFLRASRDTFDEEEAEISARQINLLTEVANSELLRGNLDAALKLCAHAARREMELPRRKTKSSRAKARLMAALSQVRWRQCLGGHELSVNFAAFSPDGARVVTAGGTITAEGSTSASGITDDTARVWDARTGMQIMVLRGHEHQVTSAVFNPAGTTILTASTDGTARIWDATTGTQIAVLQHPPAHGVNCATFSPDGRRVVTAADEGTAHLWDVDSAKEIAVLRGHDFPVFYAGFSPDGRRVVTASMDDTARVWDVESGQQILRLQHEDLSYVHAAAFSADGARIVTGSGNNLASIWDAATGDKIADLAGHDDTVYSVEYSPDGRYILTASGDKTARLWDAATAKQIDVLLGHQDYVQCASFSPDGASIVTASDDTTARIWDVRRALMEVAVFRGHTKLVSRAVYSPDGSRMVSASDDHTARIWDVKTAAQIAVLRGHQDQVRSAFFDSTGSRIITASEDWTACLWDASTAKQLFVLRGHRGRVTCAAFSPRGNRAVTSSDDGTARVWNTATGAEIRALQTSTWCPVQSAAFSPDGSRIITGTGGTNDPGNNYARIWDAVTGEQLAVLPGHSTAVSCASFSPDGRLIVTKSDRVRVWDAASYVELLAMPHARFACFSPDGSQILTIGTNIARFWDAETGIEIGTLETPAPDEHLYAAFSPDGKFLLITHLDSTVRIWRNPVRSPTVEALVGGVCSSTLRGFSKFDRDTMRLAGYSDATPEIDVCADLNDATHNGRQGTVALTLERGADPDSVDRIRATALHVASHSGHAAVVGEAAQASGATPSGSGTTASARRQPSAAAEPKQGLYPNEIDARKGALTVALLFDGDNSEASLEIVDAIMATAELLRQDADAATAAIRKTFPYEHLEAIEILLRRAAHSDSECLALCGGYAGQVACKNLGATWTERDGAAGVEFADRGRFVALLELCTSRQYAALKAELAGGASASPPREARPKPQTRTATSQPLRSMQRPTPTKSEPGPVWWVLHYIIEFPFLLFKIFLGGFIGGSIGAMPVFILHQAIYGNDRGPAPVFGIAALILGIAGLVIGVYLGAKSGLAKYKQGIDPLD